MQFYNEFDPFAASWLRNLIAAGELPEGTVDERSINDVAECDYGTAHFFAGIGGWPLALRLAGWPIDRPVWTGSCPCQPFSSAGKRKGEADDRHLWPEFFRLIRQHKPATIFGEQVASPDGLRWLDGVFADLEGAGYTCGAADLCAAGLGSPHIRQRLFWVAVAKLRGLERADVPIRSAQQGQAAPEQRRMLDGVANHTELQRIASTGQQSEHEQDGGNGVGLADTGHDAESERTWGPRRRGESAIAIQDGENVRLGSPSRTGLEGRRLQSGERAGECSIGAASVADGLFQPVSNGRTGQWIAERWSGETAWSSSRIIACLDGKSRRVGCGVQPLAHGVPVQLRPMFAWMGRLGRDATPVTRMARLGRRNRVGRLKGYGNAIIPQVAAMFIRAFMEGENGCSISAV